MKLHRVILGLCVVLCLPGAAGPDPRTYLIQGARVADGTGKPLVQEDVRVSGDRILELGRLASRQGERVVPGDGLVLAPGFIDVHNHSTNGLVSDPLAETQVSQGITTLVLGPDGDSSWPIADYLKGRRESPAAVNVMTMVGHETVRRLVMGKDYKREARPEEVAKMAQLVEQAMREGAIGFSSGLEYDVGSWASTDELVALCAASARYGGFYMTHSRDEGDRSLQAVTEAIAICERAKLPLQISHIKLATVRVWGKTNEVIALMDAARARGGDMTADCYPYEAWHADLYTLVPNKKYFDPASVSDGIENVGGAGRVTITSCKAHPSYAFRTLEDVAKAEGITPVQLFSNIIRDGGAEVIGHSMKEEDVASFYRQPWVMVASDGGIGSDHPRGAGTFPRVLGRFVREQHLLSLEEAIRKMTSLPARRVGLTDRGTIAPGQKADLVLFDPATVIDRSTFEDPRRLSEGIAWVAVNGEAVWSAGKATGARPGRVLPGNRAAAK